VKENFELIRREFLAAEFRINLARNFARNLKPSNPETLDGRREQIDPLKSV
jgi:hypothetical protein